MEEFTTFRELRYTRPDFAELKKQLRKLGKQLKNAPDYDSFRSAYEGIEKLIIGMYTDNVIVSVRNTCDKTDSFYENEQKLLSRKATFLELSLLGIAKNALKSPFRSRFDEEYGEFLTKKLENMLGLMSVRTLGDEIRENRLCQRYSRDAALCKTVFMGEECNFYGLVKHMESPDREERREAFLAWADLYESVSPKLDKTYDELVKLRKKKAEKLGFPNYIEYIYKQRNRFDYGPSDVENFRNNVRDIIVPFCSELYEKQRQRLGVEKLKYYDEDLVFPEGNAVPIGTKDELVEKAGRMYSELSPETGEYFDFMCEHGLFDLETRPGKHLGGYCTFLPLYAAPFIFSNFNGTSADVDVLTHEAGHAFQLYIASRYQKTMMSISSTSEINEIHSMSMEHFAYPWMDSFFGDRADRYRYAHLCGAVCSIPYLVAVDEFQHRVFASPDAGASQRRKIWHEIEKIYLPWRDYDTNAFLSEGGFWMQKQHIFLYPFYYVDYALAQICAFQFLVRDRQDHEKAWDDYVGLCRRGGSVGYFDLLASAGLDSPFEKGTIGKVMDEVGRIIHEFEQKT